MTEELTLRDRTRRAVRAEIVDAAMALFLSEGFDATTVDAIAHAAGISRRSFFRYFAGKDEALAEALVSLGRAVAAALAVRPEGEQPWSALRGAFDPLVERADADPNAAALARLMLERPDLQHGKNATWQVEIVAVLQPRLSEGDPELRAHALVVAAITCLHVAQQRWLAADESRALSSILDVTMGAVHPLAESSRPRGR